MTRVQNRELRVGERHTSEKRRQTFEGSTAKDCKEGSIVVGPYGQDREARDSFRDLPCGAIE